ncbi:Kinase [Hexamita inflata]|uniref:non-specific serine/threonine protein kinase n=1 Tax=Hexamita inflata TaxID=28002 RepID=A0AA86NTN0_9EUKA|nr:Kinase [Hexamita inflata]
MKQTERAEALREAEVLKQFDHPNIVKYVDTFMDKRNLYIVMEYADGGDIHQLIEDQKKSGVPMPEDQIMFYFVQILLALKHVHDKKTLHRDLKGQNIFLDQATMKAAGPSKLLLNRAFSQLEIYRSLLILNQDDS